MKVILTLPQNNGIKFFKNEYQDSIYKVYAMHYSSIDRNKKGELELIQIDEVFVFDECDEPADAAEWNKKLTEIKNQSIY